MCTCRRDKDGLTAFINAAENETVPIVQLLVSEHSPCLLAYSPSPSFTLSLSLSFSAGGGHNDTTKLLLEHGADVNAVVAATPEYIEQVGKAIAEGKEDVDPQKDGVTALVVAAQGGHLGTVTMLVEARAEVRVLDDEDMTPLLNAVMATYLVQHGADSNDVSIDEKKEAHNLLMDAIVVSNTELASLLVEKGANIKYADEDGVTVLTQAAFLCGGGCPL